MAIKPILFSGPMVLALLEGRKTQTRRLLKLPTWASTDPNDVEIDEHGIAQVIARESGCFASIPMRFAVRDLLWVRETWQQWPPQNRMLMEDRPRIYRATDEEPPGPFPEWSNWADGKFRWRPGIHMNRWASRITLEVTNVRIARLNDISAEDAVAEGIASHGPRRPQDDFVTLWESINGPYSWAANPWVVALTFTVHKCNVDQFQRIGAAA